MNTRKIKKKKKKNQETGEIAKTSVTNNKKSKRYNMKWSCVMNVCTC